MLPSSEFRLMVSPVCLHARAAPLGVDFLWAQRELWGPGSRPSVVRPARARATATATATAKADSSAALRNDKQRGYGMTNKGATE